MKLYSGDIVRVRDYPFNDGGGSKSRYAVFLSKLGDDVLLAPATQIGTLSGRAGTIPVRAYEVEIPEHFTKEIGIKGVVKCDRFPLINQDQIISDAIGRLPLDTRIQMIEKYQDITKNYRIKRSMDNENRDHPKIMENFKDIIIAEKLFFIQDKDYNYEDVRMLDCEVKGIYFHLQKEGIPFQQVSLSLDSNTQDNHIFKVTITTNDDREVFLRKLQSIETPTDVLQLDSRYQILQQNLSLSFNNINHLHNKLDPHNDFQPLLELAQEVIDNRVKEHEIWLGTDGREGRQLILNGLDLSNCEFKRDDLQQAIFYRCHFQEMDLKEKDFQDAEFDLCSLRIVNLDQANLSKATFQDCDLIRTNLSRTIMENTRFIDMELMPISKELGKEVPRIYFQEAQLKNVEFVNTRFSPTLLEKISKENIQGITVKEREFSGLAIHIEGSGQCQLLSKRGNPIEHAKFDNFNEAKKGLISFLQYEKAVGKDQTIDR